MPDGANWTLIVVGCDAGDTHAEGGPLQVSTHQKEQDRHVSPAAWRKCSAPSHFQVHLAPSCPQARTFPWYNKPWSFLHWVRHALPGEEAVAILDPDQFFLAPLRAPGPGPLLTSVSAAAQRTNDGIVAPKRAVGQQYGFGASWFRFREKTCPPGSPCLRTTDEEAHDYYAVGPPLILHREDLRLTVPLWFDYMAPVLKQPGGSDILADMWAYSMATAHLGIIHQRYDHYMVSNTRANGEGWDWVDAIQSMSCRSPDAALAAAQQLPTVLHAASHVKAGVPGIPLEKHDYFIETHPEGGDLWNFHKGHVPAEFLHCDQPLLSEPPDNLFDIQTHRLARREAFFVCLYIGMANRAALDFKRRNCPNGFNSNRCVRMVVTHTQAHQERHKPGRPSSDYALAYREC